MSTAYGYLSDTNYTKTERVRNFYDYLAQQGEGYGVLGAAVSYNDTWQGELANNFAEQGAKDNGGGFEYGSTEWVDLNYDLALKHYDAYDDNSGGTPTREQIQTYHNEEYVFAGLDPDDWLPNKLLDDSADPDALWGDFVTNEGAGDLLGDAATVTASGGKLLFGPWLLYEGLVNGTVNDAELAFAKNLLNALANMSEDGLSDMANDLNPLQDLAEFLAQFPEGARNLLDDYGWALGNPGALWDALAPNLPSWIPGVTGPFGDAENTASPLVLDIAGTGISLAALGGAGSVYWNITEGDFAHAAGWIAEGSGLLAIDLDESGTIDDHSELFGTETTDGFTVLSAYDSNSDDAITSADDDWDKLLVWVDANSDGHSQVSELHTLDDLLITSINLNATQVDYDIAGNHISHESTFTIDGQTHDIVDAWFEYDVTNSTYVGDYDLDIRALFLPTLRGYGNLPDLHIAMSLDETLLDMVQELALADVSTILDSSFDFGGRVQDIMFRWAGVDEVDPSSRGALIDARHLGFLEEFVGREWLQLGMHSNPAGMGPIASLIEAWTAAFQALSGRLAIQTAGASLFSEMPTYNPTSDTIDGSYEVALGTIENLSAGVDHQNPVQSILFWQNVLSVLDSVVGLSTLAQTTIDDLDDIIQADDPHGFLSYTLLADAIEQTGSNGDTNANLLFGTFGSDTIYANGGNDFLIGGAGKDVLYGGAGNDVYVFKLGHGLRTGAGASYTYLNQVREGLNEGADKVVFGAGIVPDDVQMWTDSNGNLYIRYSEDDYIWVQGSRTLTGGVSHSLIGEHLESIEFADGTVWDLTSGLHLKTEDAGSSNYGTAYNDIVEGGEGNDYLFGGGGDDILIGNGGFDQRNGGVGDDTYQFSLGHAPESGPGWKNQVIENLSAGTDTILFTAEIDPDDVRLWAGSNGTLYIKYSDTDTIWVPASATYSNGVYHTRVGEYVESIEFDDETVWDLTGGLHLKNHDTGGGVYGTVYNDIIEGGAGNDALYGGNGNDILIGNGGYDSRMGGVGDDTYQFSLGHASGSPPGWKNQVIENLSAGTDTILFTAEIDPDDVRLWAGSNGTLYIKYSDTDTIWVPASATYSNGVYHTRVGEYVESIEFDDETVWDLTGGLHLKNHDTGGGVYGTVYNDIIEGGAGNDALYGGDGADTLMGGAGNDSLNGGVGDDLLVHSAGLDSISEWSGNDTLWITGGATINDIGLSNIGTYDTKITITTSVDEITIYGLRHTSTSGHVETVLFDDGFVADLPSYQSWLWGSSGSDVIAGNANDNVLIGKDGDDEITAGAGNDHAHGGAGADTIYGEDGDDLLYGGDGNDVLYGGDGLDFLVGGAGADTFVFEAASAFNDIDVIKDFDVTNDNDVIDIVDLLSAYDPLTDAITDFVQITDNGTDSTLKVDVDGGADNFVTIATIEGVTGLTDEAALVTSGNLLAA
jgi:Ca2+-binding RTX toxin-like protein